MCLSVMDKTNGQDEQNFRMSEQNYQQIGVTLICEFYRSLKLFLENNYYHKSSHNKFLMVTNNIKDRL